MIFNRSLTHLPGIFLLLSFWSFSQGQETPTDIQRPALLFPEEIRGNWFRMDGSREWVYSFFDSVAIWNSELYNLSELDRYRKKTYRVSIRKEGREKILFIRPASKGNLLVGKNPDVLEEYGREPLINTDCILQNDEEFQPPVFKRDTAIIRGYLKGFVPNQLRLTLVRWKEILDDDDKVLKFRVEPDGTFEVGIPVTYPQEVQFFVSGRYRNVFVQPGKTTFVFLEAASVQNKSPIPLFMGSNARINNDLQSIGNVNLIQYLDMIANSGKMSWTEYKEWSLRILQEELDSLDSRVKYQPACRKALEIKRLQLECQAFQMVLYYPVYQSVESELQKKPKPIRPAMPGRDFFSFLSPDVVNNPVAPVAGAAFGEFIAALYETASEYNTDNGFHQVLTDSLGLTAGLASDFLLFQRMQNIPAGEMRPFTQEEIDSIGAWFSTPFLSDSLLIESKRMEEQNNARRVANLSRENYYTPEVPDYEGDRFFEALIEQYPGKVVFIDFWATWCGPCKAGIQRMGPLKEEYRDRDIVFLYITDLTSPPDTWNLLIPGIPGYHYRLNAAQYKLLNNRFNIKYIPRYMLVDKSGKMISDNLGSVAHTNDGLKRLFEEYLNQ